MRYIYSIIVLCAYLASCTSDHRDSTNKTIITNYTGPFDLANLTLREKDAPGLIAANSIKPENVSGSEQTLAGYEVLKSSSAKMLRFGGADLSGANGVNKNHVLFHYKANDNALAFYEVKLYTEKQTDVLLQQLKKLGKPAFEKLGLDKGEVELDLNGNMVEKGKERKQTYQVWENKKNGLSYFLGTLGTGKDFEAELTVLNRSGKYAKDWISLGSLDWYKH